MVYLSVLSFLAAILYMRIGLTAFFSNKSSRIFRVFLIQAISFTIWSFAEGFVYLAQNTVQYSFWNKIGAFGWCTFEALLLYFVLLFTENKLMQYRWVKYLILAPAFVFLYMVLFLFGPNIHTSPLIQNVFYIGDFLYNFTYLGLSIVLILLWGKNSKSRIHKKQAIMISVSSVIPFLLNLLFAQILPALGVLRAPGMGQIFAIIMFLGINYAITEYQFMSIPTRQITYKLFHELPGLTFLLNSQGNIMRTNQQVRTLLDCSDEDMTGKPVTAVIHNRDVGRIMADCESITEKIQLDNIYISAKSGEVIPFRISIVPLRSRGNLLRGILLIGEDLRATLRLQGEIEKHKLTNNQLKNSEQLFRGMLGITPVAIMLISRQTRRVIYLNEIAVTLFGSEDASLIGIHCTEFFVDSNVLNSLSEGFYESKCLRKAEVQLKKKNGTTFIALLTMIPSIFHEEEVALCCIVDMTDQKRVEQALKRNNDYIKELNAELTQLNHNLQEKSIRDGLTNLYNHQHINETLEDILQEAIRDRKTFCVMMMDIDHFKRVNDRFGHVVGDHVLSTVAEIIDTTTGEYVYVGRYGGEEFFAIMPDTSMDEAIAIAEAVRRHIQEHDFGKEHLKVTISMGLAQYAGETANDLINKADMLLYQAKHNGRNRVENQLQGES